MSTNAWAVFTYATEAHGVPGMMIDGQFRTYRHLMVDGQFSKDCPCRPEVTWDSAAAPLPLYTHRAPLAGQRYS